jgi:type IV secretory pathway VirB3-like protein
MTHDVGNEPTYTQATIIAGVARSVMVACILLIVILVVWATIAIYAFRNRGQLFILGM